MSRLRAVLGAACVAVALSSQASCLEEETVGYDGGEPFRGDGGVPFDASEAIAEQAKTACEELGNVRLANGASKLATGATANDVNFWVAYSSSTDTPWLYVEGYGTASSLAGKNATLGSGVNASYDTCTHCLFVQTGCNSNSATGGTTLNCERSKFFYAKSGSARFDQFPSASGQAFAGVFNAVHLEEVTFDSNGKERFVPDGGCVNVASLQFSTAAKLVSNDGGYDAGSGLTTSSEGGLRQTGGSSDPSYTACSTATDCSANFETKLCLSVSGQTTKLCSKACTSDADCTASGGACISFASGTKGYCMASCASATCRSGTTCKTYTRYGSTTGAKVCSPW